MSKKLLLAAVAVMLVSLLVGGATFALFTDSATNSGNTFAAGRVDISSLRNQGDTVPGPMFYTTPAQGRTTNPENPEDGMLPTGLWAPGDSHMRQLDVYNLGSLAIKLTKIKADVDPASSIQPGSPAYTEFANKMNIKVELSGNAKVLYNGPLAGLLGGWVDIAPGDIVTLAASNSHGVPNAHLTFTAVLDKSAGNVLQGTNPIFSFSVWAEQLKNNP